MEYAEFDPEVVSLCKAINRIGGLYTIESCSGHGKTPFRIYFRSSNINKPHQGLPVLLYYVDT